MPKKPESQKNPQPSTATAGFKRLRKEQLRYILDNISDFLCLHDLEGYILAVNRSWQNHAGTTDAQWFKGRHMAEFIPEKYQPDVAAYIRRMATQESSSGIVSLLPGDKTERVMEYNSLRINDYENQPIVLVCLGPDITDRLKSEQELKNSEEKYRSILETIEDGYYEVDLEGNITFCNPSLSRILGYSETELLCMNYRQFCDREYRDTIYQTFNSVFRTRKPTKAFDWKLTRKDGSICFIEASVSLIEGPNDRVAGFRGICRDVTERIEADKERQSLESQLFYSQKTEALGTLAGGFAHNFNNILFPLIGYLDMAIMEAPGESRQRQHLQKALESANRAKEIVRRVQEYTRNDKVHQAQRISIPDTVNQALRLVGASLSRRIKLSVNMEDDCPPVMADPDQIEQLVVNLCTNANEAIAVTGGAGQISVYVSPEEVKSSPPEKADGLAPGRYVRISVRDSGCGIDPEIAERIFDPFFTTKPETGKGLGLSLSHRIVKKYGGEIFVENAMDQGAIVHVYLPQIQAAPIETEAESKPL